MEKSAFMSYLMTFGDDATGSDTSVKSNLYKRERVGMGKEMESFVVSLVKRPLLFSLSFFSASGPDSERPDWLGQRPAWLAG